MGTSESYNIVVIGAGNVAHHLARDLSGSGHHISCIFSKGGLSAKELAVRVGAVGTAEIAEVPETADFYIVAVPDHAIPGVIRNIEEKRGIWVHTAGAVDMNVFEGFRSEYGVLYPLQTISRERDIDLSEVPFLVEASSPAVLEKINSLAGSLSEKVYEMISMDRLVVHVSAIFANNFTNQMIHVAQTLMEEKGLDFQMLAPLLKETISKLETLQTRDAQTGPAIRDDWLTMEKHLTLLKDHPEWQKMYTFISQNIRETGIK